MADYTMDTEAVTRYRFRLPTPSNGVELGKALNAAAQLMAEQRGISQTALPDDALTVTTADDEIVIWWESPQGGEAGHTG